MGKNKKTLIFMLCKHPQPRALPELGPPQLCLAGDLILVMLAASGFTLHIKISTSPTWVTNSSNVK
jgi:hypothetical protein